MSSALSSSRVAATIAIVAICSAAYSLFWLPGLDVPEARSHVFAGVTLVDPESGRRGPVTLTVRDGTIASVAEGGEGSIEFEGRTVLPGLIDLHVHHPPRFALGSREAFGLLFLAHGVTSVRDTGSLFGDALSLARRSRSGRYAGPRVFSCGPLVTGVDPVPVGMRGISGPEEADALVADLASEGVDCIKLHNGLDRHTARALVSAAARRGLPAVAHVSLASPLDAFAGAEVQHLMKVSPSWSRVRHDAAERYAEISLRAGIAHTPTLVVFDTVAARARGEAVSEQANFLPGYFRDALWNAARNPTVSLLDESVGTSPGDRIALMLDVTRTLHARGVPLQAGTDTPNPGVVPGESLQRELALLVDSGLDPEEAWAAATRTAGERLGVEKLGALEVGAPADLLFFREDPTRDLAALDTLEAVMVDGRLHRMSEIETALAKLRERFEGFVFDGITGPLARAAIPLLAPSGPSGRTPGTEEESRAE